MKVRPRLKRHVTKLRSLTQEIQGALAMLTASSVSQSIFPQMLLHLQTPNILKRGGVPNLRLNALKHDYASSLTQQTLPAADNISTRGEHSGKST